MNNNELFIVISSVGCGCGWGITIDKNPVVFASKELAMEYIDKQKVSSSEYYIFTTKIYNSEDIVDERTKPVRFECF